MNICKRFLAVLGGLAALLAPIAAQAQLPSVRFSLLDGLPAASTSFPGTVSGEPLSSHSPVDYTLQLSYTFQLGSPLTPGNFEIGGRVTEADPLNSSFAVDLVGANIGNSGGIPLYDPAPGATDNFFVPNDSGDGFGDPTWSVYGPTPPAPLLAGNYEDIDLGHLEVNSLLAWVNNNEGVGTWNAELDYGLIVEDDVTGTQLPVIIPGPPSIDVQITITPNGTPTTPEPGAVTVAVCMAISGTAFLMRRRRR